MNQMPVDDLFDLLDLFPIGMPVEVHAHGNQWDGCEGQIEDWRDANDTQRRLDGIERYGVRLEDYGITLTFARELLVPLGSIQRGGAARLL